MTSMAWFDFLEDWGIVNEHTGQIKGCLDEYKVGIQICDKLRRGFLNEDDENFASLREKESEFIFCLFKYLAIGGSMCQYDMAISEYLDQTKSLYKDLVSVERDPDTKEFFC